MSKQCASQWEVAIFSHIGGDAGVKHCLEVRHALTSSVEFMGLPWCEAYELAHLSLSRIPGLLPKAIGAENLDTECLSYILLHASCQMIVSVAAILRTLQDRNNSNRHWSAVPRLVN